MTLEKWLNEVEKRCKTATDGPWYRKDPLDEDECGTVGKTYFDVVRVTGEQDEEEVGYDSIIDDIQENDASFIAHSRIDLPLVLKMLRRAIKQLEYNASHYHQDPDFSKQVLADIKEMIK